MDGTKQTVSQKICCLFEIPSTQGKEFGDEKMLVSRFPLHLGKLRFFNILIFKDSAGTASQELGLQKASAAEDNEKLACL